MSRSITTAVGNALVADEVKVGFFAEFSFDTITLRLWSGVGNLVWDSKTWIGGGSLLSLSSVKETSELKAEGMAISLSGASAELISLALAEDYNGRPAVIYFATFVLANGGAKVVEIADPFEVFRGRMDVMSIKDDPGGEATIALTLESRLIDLARTSPERYTNEYQKIVDPTDKSLEFISALQDREFAWGPR